MLVSPGKRSPKPPESLAGNNGVLLLTLPQIEADLGNG
jgi:hypothetical protein